MKKISALLIVLIAAAGIAAAGEAKEAKEAAEAKQKKSIIAVFDFELKAGVPEELKIPLSAKLREALFSTNKYEVIDKSNIEVILKQQGEQLKECYSQECAVEVGRLVTAQKILTGSVSKLGKAFSISLSLTNLESGLMEKVVTEQCRCELEDLSDFVAALALKIIGEESKMEGKLEIKVTQTGADVEVDGRLIGSSPLTEPRVMKLGKHTVKISKTGYEPWQRDVTIENNKTISITATLSRKGGVVVSEGTSMHKLPGWLLLSAGVMAGAGGGFYYMNSAATFKKYNDAETNADLKKYKDQVNQELLMSRVLGGVSVVAIGTSLYFLLKPAPANE
jgi:hypothetical protein